MAQQIQARIIYQGVQFVGLSERAETFFPDQVKLEEYRPPGKLQAGTFRYGPGVAVTP